MIEAIRWLLTDEGQLARRLRRLTKVGLLVILFFALFLTIPFEEFASTLFSAHPLELTLGLLLGIPASFLTAVQLTILVRMQGIQLRLLEIFSINLATKFYSLVTPGSIIGSGIRWLKISRPQGMPVESLAFGGGAPFFQEPRHLLVMSGLITIARMAGTPYMAWSVSSQRVQSRIAKAIFGWVLRGAQAITVRDEHTLALFQACGVRSEISLTPDPAYSLESGSEGRTARPRLITSRRNPSRSSSRSNAMPPRWIGPGRRDINLCLCP